MSARQASAVNAVYLQLMGAVDAYALETARLSSARVDPEAYHRMRVHLDDMRRYAQDVPGLSASWVELLIRHFELLHVRWKIERGEQDLASLHTVVANHDAAVQSLRTLCRAMLAEAPALRG
jgi:hypothetical protein